MAAPRFFQIVSVSSGSFPAVGTGLAINTQVAGLGHLMLYNKDATNIVEFSYDGTTVHGELDPKDATRGQTDDDHSENMLYLRLKSGSAGPANVFVKAWVTQ